VRINLSHIILLYFNFTLSPALGSRIWDRLKASEETLFSPLQKIGRYEHMYQNIVVERLSSQPLLSLNMRNVNELFPGFAIGDFAVLHGSSSVISLTSLLCVRAQLPVQLGGLGGNVVFVDGGNTFQLYHIARLAKLHRLDPKQTLERIFISRAFTAYQMTALVLEKLKETIKRYNAKLVVISDIAGFFLDKDIAETEARRVYSQVMAYLSKFAKENQIALVATYPPHQESRRNTFLHEVTCGRADTVISLKQTRYEREFILEKHPRYILGVAALPFEMLTLENFLDA
jgi:hypothetical protein